MNSSHQNTSFWIKTSHLEYGFTIIEVMAIIAIIGIVTVMAIPRIGTFSKYNAQTITRRVIADMRYARRLAITNSKDHIVRFSSSGGSYEYSIFRKDGILEEQVGATKQIPAGIICAGDDEFTFHKLGNASYSDTGTVSLSAEGNQYDVNVIATTGRIY